MDVHNGLAVRLIETEEASPREVDPRDSLARPAPMAMPRQPLAATRADSWGFQMPRASDSTPNTSPRDIVRRRCIFFGSSLTLTALALWAPAVATFQDGVQPLQTAAFLFLSILLLALSTWCVNAVAGLYVMLTGKGRDPVRMPHLTPAPQARTALLMPVYHEDAQASVARLQKIERSLAALHASRHFDIFILSDSRRPEVADEEWAAFQELQASADCAVYYRRRAENHERKVGNVSDWIRRFGGAYDYMVVLDADSAMGGSTLLKLVDAMERHPGVGLIQTAPTIVGGGTLFARASQFGVKLYGRVAAAGLAWWCGSEGTYWGHNAIIRTNAFASSCGLPTLKGKKPFGGHVMSHDVVEAALLRRAGWAVHIAADLGESTEETPPGMGEFMVRERRWAQGNLQHLALVGAPGLHWVSRLQFMMGAMAYLASPLWLMSIVLGLAIALQNPMDWDALFWLFSPQVSPFLWGSALCTFLLMGPKFIGLALVLSRPAERRAFGGTATLLRNAALEAAISAITAPMMMARNSRTVFEVLIGRDSGWAPQRRTAEALSAREATRQHGWELGVGVILATALAFRPDLTLVFAPILLPLMFTGPVSALLSDPVIGARARASGLIATPDELRDVAPPPAAPVRQPIILVDLEPALIA